MASGKLSPRQKMINMMYLVLTALLAMNVSKEIVEAFVTIDKGQQNTREAFEGKLNKQYADFSANYQENPEKYGVAYKKAEQLKKAADDLVTHMNRIKAKAIAQTEGIPMESVYNEAMDTVLSLKHVNSKDNRDANTNIMIGGEPASPKDTPDEADGYNYSAVNLNNMLKEYKKLVAGMVSDNRNLTNAIKNQLNTDSVKVKGKDNLVGWEENNFYHVPIAATHSILSSIQASVRNAESAAIGHLFSDVEASSYKFTELVDAVIPQAVNVTTGANYEADVFLAAYDGTNAPEIRLGKPGVKLDTLNMELKGEFDVLPMEGTKGKVKIPSGGLGAQHREGVIIFRPVGLPEKRVPYNLDYNVVAPTLVVSPTKMNVFYKGVPNPVSVSVPGFTDKDITPRIDNGNITKGSDGYIVNVSSGTVANISCATKLPDGSTKSLGPVEFRVKSVPDPVPQFAGKSIGDDNVKKNELTAAQGCIAKMKDFDFDLKFEVTRFRIGMVIGGQYVEKESNSNRVTADMKVMLEKAKRGQKIFIEGIKAQGPDGSIRNLGSIALKITG